MQVSLGGGSIKEKKKLAGGSGQQGLKRRKVDNGKFIVFHPRFSSESLFTLSFLNPSQKACLRAQFPIIKQFENTTFRPSIC